MNPKISYGGQAVLEGVMIRGPKVISIAVRRPDQGIVTQREISIPWSKRHPLLGLPVIRGFVGLCETLGIGINALLFSANQAAASEGEELSKREMTFTVAAGVALAVLIFIVTPTYLLGLIRKSIDNIILANLVEGSIRIVFLIGYVGLISRIKDIERVLQYHGAEHKVIHAYEKGLDLTVENARRFPKMHPRCGTSFLFLVMLVSVVVFSFLGWPNLWMRIAMRLALLPLVAGISYELLKLSGRLESPWLSWITWPGCWLQRFTTREPDDSMIEVAITALKGAQDESMPEAPLQEATLQEATHGNA